MTAKCPKCNQDIDAATAVDMSGDLPKAGDLCMCWTCGFVMKFDGPVPLPRALTPEEERDILSSPEIMDAFIKYAVAKKASLQ